MENAAHGLNALWQRHRQIGQVNGPIDRVWSRNGD